MSILTFHEEFLFNGDLQNTKFLNHMTRKCKNSPLENKNESFVIQYCVSLLYYFLVYTGTCQFIYTNFMVNRVVKTSVTKR